MHEYTNSTSITVQVIYMYSLWYWMYNWTTHDNNGSSRM